MRAINHALTGTLIGLLIEQPAAAVPIALASHFVCDAIPHHGGGKSEKSRNSGLSFEHLLIIDTVLCVVLVIILALTRPENWILAAACAFVAASPDFLHYKRWRLMRRGIHAKLTPYGRFANGIQWFERPIGGIVEVAWALAAIILIGPFIFK